jgi:hypothetical protein
VSTQAELLKLQKSGQFPDDNKASAQDKGKWITRVPPVFFSQEILKSQGQSNGATVQGRALSSIGRGLICEAGKSGLRCPICFFVKHTKLTHKSPKGQKDRGQTAGNGAEKHLSFRDCCGNYFYLRCRTGRARDTSANGAR